MKSKVIEHNKFLKALLTISFLVGSTTLVMNVKPSQAENCTAFPVVGSENKQETEVTKTVSQPSLPIPIRGPFGVNLNNNWNTDFSIVPLKQYKKYLIKFTAKSAGEYKIRGYLKYNDNTAEAIYDKQSSFSEGQVLEIEGKTKGDNIPYQINFFVGDPISLGKTYTVSVSGCV